MDHVTSKFLCESMTGVRIRNKVFFKSTFHVYSNLHCKKKWNSSSLALHVVHYRYSLTEFWPIPRKQIDANYDTSKCKCTEYSKDILVENACYI